ncbi:phenylalanine--tRNA ligase subunit beta [Exiguobacterium sp. AM39-5BH]|uniref:phenylalanine--tRNA ligase subunit beta n=1 Tax=Exiguobacterium sp. AM39-5BH TaxID=2292355 RepID=UPI000FE1E938|nr:phenylalanine--tRNA ligase subunit beta [Exiguobacterium sp. AM39-5BH]RHB51774.1 phenylalanine--tRNA ligase subunit beta [Exiguobacterium sp. AM39-5BH]
MLLSKKWLNQYIDVSDLSGQTLGDLITKNGIEVESVVSRSEGLSGLVVGHVLACEKHPEADKLNVTTVDIGADSPVQIVCGAPNVAAGQHVIVATVGARLPGLKIKKAKLRGVESQGMICSLEELGFEKKQIREDEQDGIHTFREPVEVGADVIRLLDLDDEVIELGLTPNRSDCLSLYGIIHEVAAILERPYTLPTADVTTDVVNTVSVRLETDNCPYYATRRVDGVVIGDSPQWLKNILIAEGVRPINNVVDVTNYVMLELGQPLHAFDTAKLGTTIAVRQAHDGEEIVTLDDVTRTLDASMMVITNGEQPVAIAGVMGGANTEVDATTSSIILESAYFAPASVRKTSRTLGLRSDSSARFEKGVDPERLQLALDRAAELIVEVSGGTISDIVIAGDKDSAARTIDVSVAYINHRLGMDLEQETIVRILERLGLDVTGDETLTVHVPSRRPDLELPADITEEVARLYGYDSLPSSLPASHSKGYLPKENVLRRRVRRVLQGAGLSQAITYSLTSVGNASRFSGADLAQVNLAMPMSEERSVLRTSLIPGLLEAARYNTSRQQANVRLYETGRVYVEQGETLPRETERVAGVLTGLWYDHRSQGTRVPVDYFVAKGAVETLLSALRIEATFEAAVIADMHPGRTANVLIDGRVIGYVGQVHPGVSKDVYGLKEVYVFELDLDVLQQSAELIYEDVPRFPSITRDLALVLKRDIPAGQVEATIKQAAGPLLIDLALFDVYIGENVGVDEKSIAFSLKYQDPTRTLQDEEVTASYEAILTAVQAAHGAEVRA